MAEQGTFVGEVQRGWQRFWAASWKVKGPVLGAAVFIVIGVIGATLSNDEDAASNVPAGGADEPTSTVSAADTPALTATTGPSPTPTATREPPATATPMDTPTPTETPTPTATPEPAGFSFGSGTKLVGEEVVAGATYRSMSSGSCYWERLSGLSGTFDDLITNELGEGSHVVTIGSADVAFSSTRCGTWTQDITMPVTGSPDGPIDVTGTLIVGVDISPGTWRADPGDDSCYWARLRGFSGEFRDLIANDIGDASPIVQISASDQGFHSTRCGTWTKIQ